MIKQLSTQQLASEFPLVYPTKNFYVTQKFGNDFKQNGRWFYKEIIGGMIGHNGLDVRAAVGDPLYAACDGKITVAGSDPSGGIELRIETAEKTIDDQKVKLEIVNYHLKACLVSVGTKIQKSQLVGLTGNTGKFTTAPHLHFGIKPVYFDRDKRVWIKLTDNGLHGFRGCIDPEIFFNPEWERLPVDERYGKPKNWLLEWMARFRAPAIHKALIKRGRHPLDFQDRELNAVVYGNWDIETVLNPALWPTWTQRVRI